MEPTATGAPSGTDLRSRRLLALRILELCAAIFRGLGPERCPDVFESAIPNLLATCGSVPGLAAPLRAMAAHDDCGELETRYVRLFVNAPGGAPAPLYESCHTEGRVMGAGTLAMRTRLEREGLAVALPGNEPPDHLALELEFLFHLLSGDREDEAGEFAREVMLPWVEIFNERLGEADPGGFHAAAGELTLALLRLVAAGPTARSRDS